MKLFVGIDGGGTRAVASATDAEGRELARVEGGAGLVRADEPTAGAAALADLAASALRAAGAELPAAGLCCALAGAGREEVCVALAAALQREAVAERIRITTDADAAFHDAFGTGAGILVIAGTGSIAWGRGEDGRRARAGGWGALLGDEGSGYALGLGALRAAARAHDGREPATTLLDAVLAHTALPAPESLIAWGASATKADIAALAPAVFAAAEGGDGAARALVAEGARSLASLVGALHARLAPWSEPPEVAFSGGLVAPERPLRSAALEALDALGLPLRVRERAVDAARGAAVLARAG
jgi:glucosamine kinase